MKTKRYGGRPWRRDEHNRECILEEKLGNMRLGWDMLWKGQVTIVPSRDTLEELLSTGGRPWRRGEYNRDWI